MVKTVNIFLYARTHVEISFADSKNECNIRREPMIFKIYYFLSTRSVYINSQHKKGIGFSDLECGNLAGLRTVGVVFHCMTRHGASTNNVIASIFCPVQDACDRKRCRPC